MKFTFAVVALCSGLLASLANAVADAPMIGIYTDVKEEPMIQYNNDGSKQAVGTATTTTSLELNANGTLRTALLSTYGKGSKSFSRGVWAEKNGWVFYIVTRVTAVGTPPPNESTYLGAQHLRPMDDGIEMQDVVAMPLVFGPNASAKRASSAELGAPVSVQDVADLRATLERILRSIPRPAYAGASSEDELKAIVHRAIAARDVEALLRVSYPTTEGLSADVPLDHYIGYMNWLALPGTPTIREEDATAAAKQLAKLKQCCGCSFPEALSPRGLFWIGRTANDGRDQSAAGFYYGVVDSKWAIIGSPLSEKAVAEKRLGKTR